MKNWTSRTLSNPLTHSPIRPITFYFCLTLPLSPERIRFFQTSSLPFIEILQSYFFRLHNCNSHATLKFHMDSQVDLNMNKASNFAEKHRNRKNHTKPYDRILKAAWIQVSSDTDVNVLLSRNHDLRFETIYPTGCFYKDNWLVNHKNQAALIKSSKNVSSVLLGDSIDAGFLRYSNIWYKLFDENTINCGIAADKIQNVLWRKENISLPQSLEYVVISCGTNNLANDDSEKNSWWSFLYCTCPQEKNEPSQNCNKWNSTSWWKNTARRQKLFIVNELLESKYTNYVNTDIHYLSLDGDLIRGNGCIDISLFYKDNLHLIEKGYLNLALSIKRKISLFQKKITNTKNIEERQKPFFNTDNFPSKPNTNTNTQDCSRTMNVSPGNYNTHSTFASIETYLLQSQPNTTEILPKKKTLILTTFPSKQAKTQSSSTRCQSNWFQRLNNQHLMNSLTRIKVISPPKINIY